MANGASLMCKKTSSRANVRLSIIYSYFENKIRTSLSTSVGILYM
jgi:hypothetical protein